jgi:pyridoxamine 5'-phosphate oxidase
MTGDPLEQFEAWFPGNSLLERVEVAVATATRDGRPSVRMVLLRGLDERGFVFFTNYRSRKGRELEENPRAALLFHHEGRQVRVEGRVEHVASEESDAYWSTRPAGARRSAAASQQSEPVESRDVLEAAVAAQPDEPARPAWWGGYRLVPETFEFWEHRDDRLHDRHRFTRRSERDGWDVVRLQP